MHGYMYDISTNLQSGFFFASQTLQEKFKNKLRHTLSLFTHAHTHTCMRTHLLTHTHTHTHLQLAPSDKAPPRTIAQSTSSPSQTTSSPSSTLTPTLQTTLRGEGGGFGGGGAERRHRLRLRGEGGGWGGGGAERRGRLRLRGGIGPHPTQILKSFGSPATILKSFGSPPPPPPPKETLGEILPFSVFFFLQILTRPVISS